MRSAKILVGSLLMILGFGWVGLAQSRALQRPGLRYPAVTDVVLLSGQVTEVIMAAGQGMPSITLHTASGNVTVLLGPYRLIMEKGIEIKEGQILDIQAFPDPRIANVYVAAEIKDSSGVWIALRDDSGVPLPGFGPMGMGRGRGGMGRGMMAGMRGQVRMQGRQGAGIFAQDPANVDFSSRVTLAGTVESVDMAPGQGYPTFTTVAGGKTATILACPYPALIQADFKIAKGDSITVVGYPLLNAVDTYLAAELQIGLNVLRLRDENGMPLFSGGRGPMRGMRR